MSFLVETAEFKFSQGQQLGVVQCNSLTIRQDRGDNGVTVYRAVSGILYSERSRPGSLLKGSAVTHLHTQQAYSGPDYFIPKGTSILLDLDYEYRERSGEGGYHTQLMFMERTPVVLDQTEEYHPTIITDKEGDDLKDLLYEELYEGLVTPMFPNLTKREELSKELFTTPEKAEEILKNIKEKGYGTTEEEKIALDGIQKYREWREYLINTLVDRGIIKELIQLVGPENRKESAYTIILNEKAIEEVITTGLQRGDIRISNEHRHHNHYVDFDEYMQEYAPLYKRVIEGRLVPLHREGDISQLTDSVTKAMTRTPFNAQKEAIEAMVKSLQYQNRVDIHGEPGVGKTLVMTAASFVDAIKRGRPLKSLILSPGHLVETTWKKEFEESFQNLIKPHIIRTTSDLIKFERKGYFEDSVNRAFILSQNVAKSGYRMMPAAVWNSLRNRFECPDCKKPVTYTVRERDIFNPDQFVETTYNRDIDFFSTQRQNNRICEECGSSMWQPINRNALPGGFKAFISGEEKKEEQLSFAYTKQGFFPRDPDRFADFINRKDREFHTNRYGNPTSPSKSQERRLERWEETLQVLEGEQRERRPVSPYRVAISEYIRKKMKGKFTTLVVDEFHEFQNPESARSSSLVDLVASIPVVIRGTGTLMNGYAHSRFFNDFIVYPHKLIRAGFDHNSVNEYQASFGVVERTYNYNNRTNRRSGHNVKSRPGISTAIFPLFLQDSTVFLDMQDLETELPPLTREDPIGVDVPEEVESGYKELAEKVARHSSQLRTGSFISRVPMLYGYLDMPTIPRELKDEEGNVVYQTDPVDPEEDKKLEELLEVIRYNRDQDRRTIVYTHYVSDGINNYLDKKIAEAGFNVVTLNKESDPSFDVDGKSVRVKKDDRQTFVEGQVEEGAEVLVVNPSLVQTGMNLIDFHSIVYYQLSYSVYTVRQADRRTWRIGQDKPCSIYFIYYEGTIQEDIAKLMATKIVAAEAIEGDMNAEGLASIAESTTAEEELAQKFYESMGVLN